VIYPIEWNPRVATIQNSPKMEHAKLTQNIDMANTIRYVGIKIALYPILNNCTICFLESLCLTQNN
jgi:hypothetical protein